MTIGDRIKFLRLKHKLSQEELGEMIGVQKAAIYKYENNIITNLKRSTIDKLSTVLHTTPAYLMGWSDDEFDIISPQEKKLLSNYNRLDDTDKKKLIGYSEDLINSSKYQEPEIILPMAGRDGKKVAFTKDECEEFIEFIRNRRKNKERTED